MTGVLVLGGTRDIGHFAVESLLEAGHDVTVLNRGRTADELPAGVERVRADRSESGAMRRAIGSRSFRMVIDTTTYTATDARDAIESFAGRVERYVFISTGQVYLVRAGIERPFRESDYAGPLIAEPEPGTADHDSWSYGVEKRAAEDEFAAAADRLPVTTLRIPVVASERDPAGRVQAYVARLLDGGPILLPDEPGLPIRQLYVRDLARLFAALAGSRTVPIGAINVSFDASMTLTDYLRMLSDVAGTPFNQVRVRRNELERRGLLPACSPFSSRWLSELDTSHSDSVLAPFGLRYTPPRTYLERIVADYVGRWKESERKPRGYDQRESELRFAAEPGAET